MITATQKRKKIGVRHDYTALLKAVSASFAEATSSGAQLFQTDAVGLWDVYLGSLPPDIRQEHNCHACRSFIRRYGGLVIVNAQGFSTPAMWSAGPVDEDGYARDESYVHVLGVLGALVRRARIVAPYYSKDNVWGTPMTGPWRHVATTNPRVWNHPLLTPGQKMAAMRQSFKDVSLALSEPELGGCLSEVTRMLKSESLARSEKFLAPVEWLHKLLARPKGRRGENVLWRAVSEAPEGFLHPRGSVLWPVIEAVKAGESFTTIKAKFDAMLGPLQYQRPQAAPSAGNIAAAEAMVEKLGIQVSLARRFATLEDVLKYLRPVWIPARLSPSMKPSAGVFGHLKPKSKTAVEALILPSQVVTWEKFSRTVLHRAERVEVRVPSLGRFTAITTAADDDAPLIFKWASPLAWYTYPHGSPAAQWGLTAFAWAPLTAIVPYPAPEFLHTGVLAIVECAQDSKTGQGNALFPECLKQELYPVRATVEAYSKHAELTGRSEASACGLSISKEQAMCDLRTLVAGQWTTYRIDRWD
jgi:hypothetical protein